MENIMENNENTDNNVIGKIIKPIQQQQQPETENNLQQQQQQQQQQQNTQQQQEQQGGITKQIETPGEKEQPLLPEDFEGEEDDDEDDDDDDEEKETSQKLIIDIPDEDEEKEEEDDEDEDDDVIALDDLPADEVLPPKEDAAIGNNNNKKLAMEAEAIITLSDGEEDIPANEVTSKPGKVQKRRSVGSNAAAGNDEERFRLKRRKINVAGAPKMPLTGYVRYMNDRRESLRKEHPTKTYMEHNKMIGEEWHALPADVKSSYLKAADVDKQRLF